jgi:hypothetical protein
MYSAKELKLAAEKGFVNAVGVEDAEFEKAVAQFRKSPNSTFRTGRKDGRAHVWRAGSEESNFFPITEADGKVKILVPLGITNSEEKKHLNRFAHVEAGLRDQGFLFNGWIYDAQHNTIGKTFEKDGKIEKLFFDDRKTSLDKAAHVCHLRGCEVNTRLLTCSGCRMVKYCGAEHQKQDWETHKVMCAQLRAQE